MSIQRNVMAAAMTAGLAIAQIAVITTAAQADGYRRGYGYSVPRHAGVPRAYGYGYGHPAPRHRDRTGDAVAGTILGIGAVIIGAAIADAARKNRHEPRYERYDD